MRKRDANAELNTQIYEEACTWFIDMRSGDVDVEARQRFDAWARKSPEHLRAYLEVSEIWDDASLVDPKCTRSAEELIIRARSSAEIVPLRSASANRLIAAASRVTQRGAERLISRRPIALAAAVAGLAAIAALAAFSLSRQGLYTTSIGEQRAVTLADGSRMELNSRTRLRVRYTARERAVDLLEGQAFFQVEKNPERPFIVQSGDVRVRAVGTQFDVFRKESGTVVTVVEGRVAVAPDVAAGSAEAPAPSPQDAVSFVSAGEQVTVTPGAAPHPVHADIAAATAWTHGTLLFSGSRLSDVVAEFNRYNERQLAIRDPALADMRISGVYSSTDPALLVRFLREQPGVTVDDSGNTIVISAK